MGATPSRRNAIGRVAIALVAVALCYLAAVTALSNAAARRRPVVAARLTPFAAAARANAAFATLQDDQSPATVARADAEARTAQRREPVNVAALRTLGLVAAVRNDLTAARAFFGLVEKLSRRDLATQLWWIEYEVSRGSVPGALTYFDEALRTSTRSADVLMPILVGAAGEAPIAAGLLPLLAKRPTYFRPFFIQATDSASDIDQVARLGRRLLDPRANDDQDLINRLLARLARDGKYDAAWAMFAWAGGTVPDARAAMGKAVINGDFERTVPFRLFNWTPTNNDALTAEVAPRDGGSDALYLIARVTRGLAAQQLLRLPAGRYRLDAVVGDVPDAPIDRPTVALTCAGSGRTILAPVTFPQTPAPTPLRAEFGVGSDCRYQWIDLSASASSEDETRAWIDDIRIRRVPNQ